MYGIIARVSAVAGMQGGSERWLESSSLSLSVAACALLQAEELRQLQEERDAQQQVPCLVAPLNTQTQPINSVP